MTSFDNSLSDNIKNFQGSLNQIEKILNDNDSPEMQIKNSSIGRLAREISGLSANYLSGSDSISHKDFEKMSSALSELEGQVSSSQIRALSPNERLVVEESLKFLNGCLSQLARSLNQDVRAKLKDDLKKILTLIGSFSSPEEFSLIKGNLRPIMEDYKDQSWIRKQLNIIHESAQKLEQLHRELQRLNQSDQTDEAARQRKLSLGSEITENIFKIKSVEHFFETLN